MEHFTPLASTIGGALLGLAAALLMVGLGKIAGISGIVAGALHPEADGGWRRMFIVAMLATGFVYAWLSPTAFVNDTSAGPVLITVAGLLVGFGTRLGSGCTSGHGVCGLPRLSPRSVVAVVTFMTFGAIGVGTLRLFGAM